MSRFTKTIIFLCLMAASPLFAQVPQGISYQAVACDANGVELINQQVRLRASILRDGPNGAPQWVEIHSIDPVGQVLKTDAFGLFTINIGQGNIQPGGAVALFQDIDWSYGNLWLKMELDATGSGTFAFIGANRMWTVPYSFYSKKAESSKLADNATNAQTAQTALDDLDKDPKNELRDLKYDPVTGTLTLVPVGQGSTTVTFPPAGDNSTTNELQNLIYDPVTGNLTLSNSSTTINLNDNDKDPTNELQQLNWDPATNTITLVPIGTPGGNTSITIPPGGDPSVTNELQGLVFNPSNNTISITPSPTAPGLSGTIVLDDNDKSPTNELQSLVWDPITKSLTLVNNPSGPTSVTLTGAGDQSETNELQILSFDPATNTLSLSPAAAGQPVIKLDDMDENPTNEIQSLIFDPATNQISITNPANPGQPAGVITLNDLDKDPANEIQALTFDPATNKISISNPSNPNATPSSITLDDADKNPTNEIQSLVFDPATNQISISNPANPGQPAGVITLDDADKNPTNEIQTLAFDPTTNKITISNPQNPGQAAGSITLDDADKNPTNELQSLNFNPTTHELSIFPPPVAGPQTISITDADADPMNEIQELKFDSTTRMLSISKGNSVSLAQNGPGFNEFPDCGGKPEFKILLNGSYTVPPGKTLFLTAAGRSINLNMSTGVIKHPNSPAMPILGEGTTVVDCNCTAYLTSGCLEIEPLILDMNSAPYATDGYTVPAGKIFVVKSGIEIDEGRLDVSIDNGANWPTITIALSPYEAASRAPTFPPGTMIRKPGFSSPMILTGYLFNY